MGINSKNIKFADLSKELNCIDNEIRSGKIFENAMAHIEENHFNIGLDELEERMVMEDLLSNSSFYHYVDVMLGIIDVINEEKDYIAAIMADENDNEPFIVEKTYNAPLGYGIFEGEFVEKCYTLSVVLLQKKGHVVVMTAYPS